MLEPKTEAEWWDREIERIETGPIRNVNPKLLDDIRATDQFRFDKQDITLAIRSMAEKASVNWEWSGPNDKILLFKDGSKLALFDMGANTIVGYSRVMDGPPAYSEVKGAPQHDNSPRGFVRGRRPYWHGTTRSARYWTLKRNQ